MSTNRMDEKLFAPVLALGLVLTAACTSESAATESSSVAAEELNTPSLTPAFASPVTPPPPAVNRDVALVESETYAYPYIPAFRTSADGRVALSLKEMDDGQLSFYVMAPERLDPGGVDGGADASWADAGVPFALSGGGQASPQILASTTPINLPDALFQPDAGFAGVTLVQQHHTLCDGTVQFPASGAKTNPYACGAGGASDCYDLTVLSPVRYTQGSGQNAKTLLNLYGVPITIRIDAPKTKQPVPHVVTVGTPVPASPTPFPFNDLLEPMVTADGHLLVTRLSNSTYTWSDGDAGPVTGNYDIVYAVGPSTAPPCDVRQWANFYPISHAYFDPNMKGVYGIADYQIRDSENNLLPDGVDIEGTYPWVDRMGRNLFFVNTAATLFVPNQDGGVNVRYPETCVPDASCADPTTPGAIVDLEATGANRGSTVVGRWTHGKEVQLDAIVNNIDYGLPTPDVGQRMVALYAAADAGADATVWVRMGSGRNNSSAGAPAGYEENSTILDSFENIFADRPAFKPLTLRDVVWRLNMGKGGDEVAFDDLINPDSFIVSEMTASTTFVPYDGGADGAVPMPPNMTYNDGFITPTPTSPGGFGGAIHLQNAATAVTGRWAIPPYGVAVGSQTRVEPAALGGIKGKGFWLQGNTRIDYPILPQPQSVAEAYWFVSLFIDSRFSDDGLSRRLLTFPDGSAVNLVGLSAIDLLHDGGVVDSVSLPAPLVLASGAWSHLSFQVSPGGKPIGVYVNGYLLHTYDRTTGPSLFQLVAPPVTTAVPLFSVGGDPTGTTAGFTGWIDELKIIAQAFDPETICNHARGTLVGLPPGLADAGSAVDATWLAIAKAYPASSHDDINAILTANGYPTFPHYACAHDYSSDSSATYLGVPGVIPDNLPPGTVSVQAGIHFPEGPLKWNSPRPDSSANEFCLSCHVSGGQVSTALSPLALEYDASVPMQDDTRRQPLQLDRLVFGNLPAGFIDGFYPPSNEQAPPSGIALDQWDYPADGGPVMP